MGDLCELDEAILHAEEKSRELKGRCSEEHKQLALWLNELKDLRRNRELAGHYFIEGCAHQEDELVELIRGDLTKLMIPFSWFTVSGDGLVPDFHDFQIIDCGQTVRLGKYEAAGDAILYDFDPIFRQQCLNRNK